jgi:hypothetical protein
MKNGFGSEKLVYLKYQLISNKYEISVLFKLLN